METTLNPSRTARLAAGLFIFLCLPLAFWEMYVPDALFVPQDPVATANNLLSNQFVFRLSILSHLVGIIIFVFMVSLFHRVFRPVDKHLSLLMLVSVLAPIPIVFVLEVFQYTGLMTLKSDPRPTFDVIQQQEAAYFLLRMARYGMGATKIFFGLSLIPFGMLVLKSAFALRIFGILLIISGISYLVHTSAYILLERASFLIVRPFVTYPFAGFLLAVIWFLVKGVHDPKSVANQNQ